MKRVLATLAIGVVVACGAAPEGDSGAASSSATTGPAAIHPGWFKTPEAIVETMTRTWELTLTAEEESRYVGGLRASLGGVNVAQQGSPIDRPHELFALALQSLATFTAGKLVAKQMEKTQAEAPYLFDGLGLSAADDGCYADDAKEWCDGVDGITIGELTARGVDPNALSRQDRKRLMHKMQSIGEFFLMAIDDRTAMPGSGRHAPAFLVDEVLLPKLREAPLTVEREKQAWQEVVTTILLGGYYFDLPATE